MQGAEGGVSIALGNELDNRTGSIWATRFLESLSPSHQRIDCPRVEKEMNEYVCELALRNLKVIHRINRSLLELCVVKGAIIPAKLRGRGFSAL